MPSWNSSEGGFVPRHCETSNDTVWNCLQQFIYNISDVVTEETHPGAWDFDLTDPIAGPYFFRGNFFNMTTKFKESYGLFMNTGVNNSLAETMIVLHDETYFISNSNPASLPRLTIQGSVDEPFERRVYIEAVEVVKLNLASNPCEPLPSYNFNQCVHKYVLKVKFDFVYSFVQIFSQEVGCKVEWDKTDSPEYSTCDTVDEIM